MQFHIRMVYHTSPITGKSGKHAVQEKDINVKRNEMFSDANEHWVANNMVPET